MAYLIHMPGPVPVQDRSVSGRLNAMMNDVGDKHLYIDVLDVSFICRHCKWEQAQNDIIERLVSVEKLGIRLTEESAERNARLDKMEESNQKFIELINEINTQLLQESVWHSNRADKQDEKIDTLK